MQTLSDELDVLFEQLTASVATLSSLLSPEPGEPSLCHLTPVMEKPLDPTRTQCVCGTTYERRPR